MKPSDVLSDFSDESSSSSSTIVADSNGFRRKQVLKTMVNQSPSLNNKVIALKNMQIDIIKINAEFLDEIYKLKQKFVEKSKPLYEKSKRIISGEEDLNDIETKSDKSTAANGAAVAKAQHDTSNNAAGIPNFWLTIFKNVTWLYKSMQPEDEPALQKLADITFNYGDDFSYTLHFHFDENDFFYNKVLTKKYVFEKMYNAEDPFLLEEPYICESVGCAIDWKNDMDLTVEVIQKQIVNNETGVAAIEKVKVAKKSFFNFFNPPVDNGKNNEKIWILSKMIETDYHIGEVLRQKIIPKAVLYYTGELIHDEFEGFNAGSDDEDVDSDEPFCMYSGSE